MKEGCQSGGVGINSTVPDRGSTDFEKRLREGLMYEWGRCDE